ncbi:sn-glycerol-3-phosphate ABC transporter ATP-binding protein UgpC [Paenibacillus aurantius]|uniref:Sn-glycerol-3-phosphate ABC transporter ATP-binding protein UgpC n=1 Tax=Paenibacillus aurantius TaxID=2918900 RepID=A0AA96L8F2_9BACL|nr:sn-glycerol-3-phosphate ABC transporter ATP-binding protein UgpC [Paenibacillus aurantius]WNQ08994.1 sn-glycerol-3-phosphate ABC transporter ATP-binding protein UgpC [Paenibacillus aurantius]
MAGVSLQHLYKNYSKNGPFVVKDVNLEIEDGEFMIFVGPSGCGKSTTLRMVAGLERISQGEIYIGEELVNNVPPKKRDIAMVFQNYALYPNMSVFENMAFGLRLRKTEKHLIDSSVKSTSRTLEIEHLLERRPRQLSGGQRQRVALGRAIVRHPKVFLMDEPLSNLDARLRVQMRSEIVDMHRNLGTTMIYVTHDQTEAMTMGSRICVMKDGIIQQVGTPEEVYMKPANQFVANFIGSPPIHFLDGRLLQDSSGTVFFDTSRYSVPVAPHKAKALVENGYINKVVTLGIRAEYVYRLEQGAAERSGEKGTPIKAVVHFSELVGADRYLHLSVGEEKLLMRVPAFDRTPEGTRLEIRLNPDYMLFFNRDIEQAIV